ncbi:hypothetical protein U1Q18_003505, partial [Sarracenia purpurea var. burkii]
GRGVSRWRNGAGEIRVWAIRGTTHGRDTGGGTNSTGARQGCRVVELRHRVVELAYGVA